MSRKNTHPEHDVFDDAARDDAETTGAAAHDDDTMETTAEQMDDTKPMTDEQDVTTTDEPTTGAASDDRAAQVEQAEAKAAEYLDSLQRERATFQNYKKRVARERTEQSRAIAGNLLLKLLPVLDDFYRAMDAVPDDEKNQWFDGVAMILRKLERYLDEQNVTEIDALGKPFDPTYHEAVGVDSDSDAESDTVTAVLQRGYMHGDHVLRPSMVRVAE